MAQQPDDGRQPDDALARQSGAVSEDVQPVGTDEDPGSTTEGLSEGTGKPGRRPGSDTVEIE
jgi:hypothetical protein